MTSEIVTRWSRAFVAAGVGWFVLAHLAGVVGLGRPAVVALGLYGFAFHVIFGKAYSLVPSYFDRELAVPEAAVVHLPLAVLGTAGLAADAVGAGPASIGPAGAASWLSGCLVFVGALAWTVRDNPLGRETGTGETNAHRRRVDRAANAFVPVVLAYLVVGAALPVVATAGVEPPVVPADGAPASHLLAAGAGALLVFAIGFRLLPRFLVSTPRPWLVGGVLAAGAVGPTLLAVDFRGGATFRAGAVLQALAVLGFAAAVGDMYARSDRRRVGFLGVLAGVTAGALAVLVGLYVAFVGTSAGLFEAHVRLALAGFLGLTIVGVTYQFYPPGIGTWAGVGDRPARLSIALLFGGLLVEAGGHVAGAARLVDAGAGAELVGAALYAYILYGLFLERRG